MNDRTPLLAAHCAALGMCIALSAWTRSPIALVALFLGLAWTFWRFGRVREK